MSDRCEFLPAGRYELLSPRQIVFGWGRRRELGERVAELGKRALVVVGSRTLAANGLLDELLATLSAAGVEILIAAEVGGEPAVREIDAVVTALRGLAPRPHDVVVAVGGGSALDFGKALAALLPQPGGASVRSFLEGSPAPAKLVAPPLPVVAAPTTAGTGSEATKNAVVSVDDPPGKRSLRDPRLTPWTALIDPELTVSVSRETTVWTGMDALTQLLESFVSRRAQPIPRALAADGFARALRWLPVAAAEGDHRAARCELAHAALLSGLALANSGLGSAHGVAASLGTLAAVPHGLACATLLPLAVAVNRDVAQGDFAALARAAGVSRAVGDGQAAEALEAAVNRLVDELGTPRRLSSLGFDAAQLPQLVAGSRGNSMAGNPRELDDDQLLAALQTIA